MSGALQSAARPAATLQAAAAALAPAPPLIQRRAGVGFVPPLASLAAIPARPAVQRTCEACGEDERDEGMVQPRRRVGSPGTPPAPPADGAATATPAAVQRTCEACGEEEESQVQPRLEVGAITDPLEAEADAIAARVMAMREADVSAVEPVVQRSCSACASSDDEPRARRVEAEESPREDEDEEVRMRPRRTRSQRGGETIPASDRELTSGGAPLPAATRGFFERRMGRDLSGVRIHEGGAARGLNDSISARAFTYRHHIWLGAGERPDIGFTMAHELAHVMQQTAPGPVGPAGLSGEEASGAAIAVRRLGNPFWLPPEFKLPGADVAFSPWLINSGKHNAAVTALAKANPGTITEVMMPNAKSDGIGCGICGFADLYRSTEQTVPGLELDCPKTDPPTDPRTVAGLKTFDATTNSSCGLVGSVAGALPTAGCTPPAGGSRAKAAGVGKGRAPTLSGGTISGGITGIQIADMKPGHNEACRRAGVDQVNNYYAGLELVRDAAQPAAGRNIYAFSPHKPMPETALSTIPSLWDPHKKDGSWPVNRLRLHMGPLNDYTPDPPVKGRWTIAKDPLNKGIWTYFLAPEPESLAAALKTPASEPADFRAANARIAKIIDCLSATPRQRKAACRRPARPGKPAPSQPRRTLVTRAPVRLQRATRKKLPTADPFTLEAWNQLRKGSALVGGLPSLGAMIGDVPAQTRAKISFQGRAIEAIDWMRDSLKVDREKPRGAASMLADKETLERAMFWSGLLPGPDVAEVFGLFRKYAGNLYVRASDAFRGARAKFRGLFDNAPLSVGAAGGNAVGRTALRILKTVFAQVGKLALRKAVNLMVDCLERGFTTYFKSLVSGGLDSLVEQAKVVGGYAADFTKDIFADMTARLTAVHKKYETTIASIVTGAKFIAKIVSTVLEVVRVARLVVCASGLAGAGVGAIITCALAIADWILSKFDASPLDWLISKAMENCTTRRLFASALIGVKEVRTLPATLARLVLGQLKDVLPDSAKAIVCDLDKDLKGEEIRFSDYDCRESTAGEDEGGDGSGGGGGGGAEGTGGGGTGGGGNAGGGAGTGTGGGVGTQEGAGTGDDGTGSAPNAEDGAKPDEEPVKPGSQGGGEDDDESDKPGPVYKNEEIRLSDDVGTPTQSNLFITFTTPVNLRTKHAGTQVSGKIVMQLEDGHELNFSEATVRIYSRSAAETAQSYVTVVLSEPRQVFYDYSATGQPPFVTRWRRLNADKKLRMKVR